MAPSSPPDDISDADEGEVRKKVLDQYFTKPLS